MTNPRMSSHATSRVLIVPALMLSLVILTAARIASHVAITSGAQVTHQQPPPKGTL